MPLSYAIDTGGMVVKILVQRALKTANKVTVTVLLTPGDAVGPLESPGDYGTIDVVLAGADSTTKKVAAIQAAALEYMSAKVESDKLVDDIQREIDAISGGSHGVEVRSVLSGHGRGVARAIALAWAEAHRRVHAALRTLQQRAKDCCDRLNR